MVIYKKILSSKTVFVFITVLLLTSCKSYFATITIENAIPAKGELPPSIQSITLMNRGMNDQFADYKKDSLQHFFYRNGFQLSKIVLDSAAADTTIRVLANLLFESGRYDVVVPVERNIKRNFPYEFTPDPLSQDFVRRTCSTFNTDALMVLERFSTKVMADFSAEKYNDPAFGYSNYYYATLDLKYDALFRIYIPGAKDPVKQIALTDTISWESADNIQTVLFRKLPSIKLSLISSGIKVALDADSILSPTWIKERRGYFLFSSKNDKGQELMNENKFDEAGSYWAELAKSDNKKIRSKAEFNMALINELNGDIDAAIDWGVKSYYSYYRNQTDAYLKRLKVRKETLQKSE